MYGLSSTQEQEQPGSAATLANTRMFASAFAERYTSSLEVPHPSHKACAISTVQPSSELFTMQAARMQAVQRPFTAMRPAAASRARLVVVAVKPTKVCLQRHTALQLCKLSGHMFVDKPLQPPGPKTRASAWRGQIRASRSSHLRSLVDARQHHMRSSRCIA